MTVVCDGTGVMESHESHVTVVCDGSGTGVMESREGHMTVVCDGTGVMESHDCSL